MKNYRKLCIQSLSIVINLNSIILPCLYFPPIRYIFFFFSLLSKQTWIWTLWRENAKHTKNPEPSTKLKIKKKYTKYLDYIRHVVSYLRLTKNECYILLCIIFHLSACRFVFLLCGNIFRKKKNTKQNRNCHLI